MCLISLAHRASDRFPFILAANRDEDLQRPTHDAHWWNDAQDVVGGRDALHGGSWLAVSGSFRFAAVTNLRGAEPRTRSRGALVGEFVKGTTDVHAYAAEVARHAGEYSGFHLLAGTVGGEIMYIAPENQETLAHGIHALSNAPHGEHWPKTALAAAAMEEALALETESEIIEHLLRFLTTRRGATEVESEIFIEGERYGTRSSTVIVATGDEIVFVEKTPTQTLTFRL
jgi:uncharacterized protein with NRDE domain